jgi:hypothetical protein
MLRLLGLLGSIGSIPRICSGTFFRRVAWFTLALDEDVLRVPLLAAERAALDRVLEGHLPARELAR